MRRTRLGKGGSLSLPNPSAFFAFLFTERLFKPIPEPGTGYGRLCVYVRGLGSLHLIRFHYRYLVYYKADSYLKTKRLIKEWEFLKRIVFALGL